MRTAREFGLLAVLLTAISLCTANAEKPNARKSGSHSSVQPTPNEDAGGSLTDDDRLSLLAAALDARVRSDEADCSHLVHAIYEQAGFTYSYAPSSDLYGGVDGFRRVKKPEPGDLVVWRGHVGIVIKPSQHIFFSVLSSGPGIDDYTSPYWKHRGKLRFYRYARSPLRSRALPQLVRTNRVRHQLPSTDDDQP